MEGMRHKLSLPGLGMSKCTDPSGAAPCRLPCAVEHHASAFEAEGYTLETLLDAVKHGEEAAMRDLRELKLNLGDCRKIINQLKTTSK